VPNVIFMVNRYEHVCRDPPAKRPLAIRLAHSSDKYRPGYLWLPVSDPQ